MSGNGRAPCREGVIYTNAGAAVGPHVGIIQHTDRVASCALWCLRRSSPWWTKMGMYMQDAVCVSLYMFQINSSGSSQRPAQPNRELILPLHLSELCLPLQLPLVINSSSSSSSVLSMAKEAAGLGHRARLSSYNN
jgi:hypothetical protein